MERPPSRGRGRKMTAGRRRTTKCHRAANCVIQALGALFIVARRRMPAGREGLPGDSTRPTPAQTREGGSTHRHGRLAALRRWVQKRPQNDYIALAVRERTQRILRREPTGFAVSFARLRRARQVWLETCGHSGPWGIGPLVDVRDASRCHVGRC
jgi:hypothetical protein